MKSVFFIIFDGMVKTEEKTLCSITVSSKFVVLIKHDFSVFYGISLA